MPDTATIQTQVVQAVATVTAVGQAQVVEVSTQQAPETIETGVVGPQGPPGPVGSSTLAGLTDVDSTLATNRSTLIYDAATGKWKANPNTTVDEVLNGGNF